MLTFEKLVLNQGDFHLSADWSMPEGGRLALIGPSGAGKTSLLMAIAGFVAPTSGRILWHGRDLASAGPGQRPVSILFQDHNLFPHLTVLQNLTLGLTSHLRLSGAIAAQLEAALLRVGLEGMGARLPAQLSGGQQARAALARALLRARPILLLDEPFAALGPALRAQMLQLVAEVAGQSGALVIMVSHDPKDILEFAGHTSFLTGGIAAAPQATKELFGNPPAALRAYLG